MSPPSSGCPHALDLAVSTRACARRPKDFERLRSEGLSYLEKTLRYSSDEELGKAGLEWFVFRGTRYAHPAVGIWPHAAVASATGFGLADIQHNGGRHCSNLVAMADPSTRPRCARSCSRAGGGQPELLMSLGRQFGPVALLGLVLLLEAALVTRGRRVRIAGMAAPAAAGSSVPRSRATAWASCACQLPRST